MSQFIQTQSECPQYFLSVSNYINSSVWDYPNYSFPTNRKTKIEACSSFNQLIDLMITIGVKFQENWSECFNACDGKDSPFSQFARFVCENKDNFTYFLNAIHDRYRKSYSIHEYNYTLSEIFYYFDTNMNNMNTCFDRSIDFINDRLVGKYWTFYFINYNNENESMYIELFNEYKRKHQSEPGIIDRQGGCSWGMKCLSLLERITNKESKLYLTIAKEIKL